MNLYITDFEPDYAIHNIQTSSDSENVYYYKHL